MSYNYFIRYLVFHLQGSDNMISLNYAVKRVLDSTIVTKDNRFMAESLIKELVEKELKELGLNRVPEFYIDLLVLEKIKIIFEEEKESKLVLQRNLTLKELKFLKDQDIKVYFGDFESFDEEVLLTNFDDQVYLLDYDVEKSFIYAHAFRFSVEEKINSYVS